jgi:hypothetical protein
MVGELLQMHNLTEVVDVNTSGQFRRQIAAFNGQKLLISRLRRGS